MPHAARQPWSWLIFDVGQKMSASLRVWLVLAKVKAVDANSAGLRVGSEALVQIFVPEHAVEIALKRSEEILPREGLRRLDVLSATSFDDADHEIEAPHFVKKDILQARKSGLAFTGTFFTSRTSASFE